MNGNRPERDYPQNHPAASDYDGSEYQPPASPLVRDYPLGHPKAADSDANIAESQARHEETATPGAPGVEIVAPDAIASDASAAHSSAELDTKQ